MNYRLAVLTSGPGDQLADTVASFAERVSPAPADVVLHCDGVEWARATEHVAALERLGVGQITVAGPQGFCRATRRLWDKVNEDGYHDHVFWLEHDFRFDRDVDLLPLAQLLEQHGPLAQVSLMRDAANPEERAAGGLYELRRDAFERHLAADGSCAWLEHSAYFTTTPSLMRRTFMLDNPFPGYDGQCEGRFGLDLVARGYRFGVWGDGAPWVAHTGTRDGFGY